MAGQRRGLHGLRSLPSAHTTLDDLVPSWMRSMQARNFSAFTIKGHLSTLRVFRAFLVAHELPLEVTQWTKPHLEAFLVEQLQHGKASSAETRYRNLAAFFRWAQEEGELTTSPLVGVKKPKVPETPPEVLTDDELRALLKVCEGPGFFERRDTAILRLFVDTGMRRSECAGLRVEDVDLAERQAHVTGKFQRHRVVTFGSKCVGALDRYLRLRKLHPDAERAELWLGRAGPMTHQGLYRVVVKRAQQSGVYDAHPHLFRHTAADHWLDVGGSEMGAMTYFGWRDHKMLTRYTRSRASQRASEEAKRLPLGDRL